MPIYVYRREDGTVFEKMQKITSDAITHCPDTGQPVKRVIQPFRWHFTGGFARQDFTTTFATATEKDY